MRNGEIYIIERMGVENEEQSTRMEYRVQRTECKLWRKNREQNTEGGER
jgi:hypothetical protein